MEVDKTNSNCARCHVFGYWHPDGFCKPEDVARVDYLKSTHRFSSPSFNYGSGHHEYYAHKVDYGYPRPSDEFNTTGDGYSKDDTGFKALQNNTNIGN